MLNSERAGELAQLDNMLSDEQWRTIHTLACEQGMDFRAPGRHQSRDHHCGHACSPR
ncbi:hypothetical protein [Dictyobacter formicarum]|uniref:hypothetical protein n=1 Tax=Dictyobacter formicarum TaxID=2778368 RepID=UPI0019166FEC|nr:hypothetical protein [Dictyobacter formicarum]